MEERSDEEGRLLADMNMLIGYTLGDARRVAAENGLSIDDISITAPPKMEITEYDNSFRVLRVHTTGKNSLTLLVCKPL